MARRDDLPTLEDGLKYVALWDPSHKHFKCSLWACPKAGDTNKCSGTDLLHGNHRTNTAGSRLFVPVLQGFVLARSTRLIPIYTPAFRGEQSP